MRKSVSVWIRLRRLSIEGRHEKSIRAKDARFAGSRWPLVTTIETTRRHFEAIRYRNDLKNSEWKQPQRVVMRQPKIATMSVTPGKKIPGSITVSWLWLRS